MNLEPVLTDDTTRRNFAKLEDLFTALEAARTRLDALEGTVLGGGSATAPAQARVFNSANIATVSGTPKILTFDSERYDVGGLHSTSVNTSRLTAVVAGLYHFGACVVWQASAAGFRQVQFKLNGTTQLAGDVSDVDSAITHAQIISTDYQLAAGDFVEVEVTQTTGGALNVLTAGNSTPEFWIHRVGSMT